MSALKNLRLRRAKRFPGCESFMCRPYLPHRPCADCGALCDGSEIRIEPVTLRRRKTYLCEDHYGRPATPQQKRLVSERREKDWSQISDPVDGSRLGGGLMPEQIPGPSRATLRAFALSPEPVAVVEGVTVTTLNQSIRALGLTGVMYAETRGTATVIRKIAA